MSKKTVTIDVKKSDTELLKLVITGQSRIFKKQLDLYKYMRLQYRLKTGKDPTIRGLEDDELKKVLSLN